MPEPTPPIIPVVDASETQADLDAKIDAELGLKPTPLPEPPADPKEPEAPVTSPVDEPAVPDEPETPDEEVEPEEPLKPSEPATPSDADLFIEVEDAEGVTHKISVIEDLPEDFNPKNNRQALEILSQLGKLEGEREQREVTAASEAEQAAVAQVQQEQFKSWDSEVDQLTKAGRLDKVTLPATDSKYLEDPTVTKVNEVFGFMNKINAERTKAGNPNTITSFEDALDKYEANEAKVAAAEAQKNDNARAKAKASLIGGSSASAGGDHYVYKAGSARSIDEIPVG